MKDYDNSFGSQGPPGGMTRRRALAAMAVATLLPGCVHQAHVVVLPVQGGRMHVPREPLAQLRGPADVLFLRAAGAPGPIALRRQGSQYIALLALCTHRGCEVQALPQSYDCPCHGSRYDLAGEVLDGPAERPLPSFRVVPDGEGVAIVLE